MIIPKLDLVTGLASTVVGLSAMYAILGAVRLTVPGILAYMLGSATVAISAIFLVLAIGGEL